MPRKRVVSRTTKININEVAVYDVDDKCVFRTILYSPLEYGSDLKKINQFVSATRQLSQYQQVTEVLNQEVAKAVLAMPEAEFYNHAQLTQLRYL